jgi:hypothetical protein
MEKKRFVDKNRLAPQYIHASRRDRPLGIRWRRAPQDRSGQRILTHEPAFLPLATESSNERPRPSTEKLREPGVRHPEHPKRRFLVP